MGNQVGGPEDEAPCPAAATPMLCADGDTPEDEAAREDLYRFIGQLLMDATRLRGAGVRTDGAEWADLEARLVARLRAADGVCSATDRDAVWAMWCFIRAEGDGVAGKRPALEEARDRLEAATSTAKRRRVCRS